MLETIEIQDSKRFIELQTLHYIASQQRNGRRALFKMLPVWILFSVIFTVSIVCAGSYFTGKELPEFSMKDWGRVLRGVAWDPRFLLIVIGFPLMFFVSRIWIKRAARRRAPSRHVFRLTKEYLELEHDDGGGRVPWTSFESITRKDEYWVLNIAFDPVGVLIPTHELTVNARRIIEEKIPRAKLAPPFVAARELRSDPMPQDDGGLLTLHYGESFIRHALRCEAIRKLKLLSATILLALIVASVVMYFNGYAARILYDAEERFAVIFATASTSIVMIFMFVYLYISSSSSRVVIENCKKLGPCIQMRPDENGFELNVNGTWVRQPWMPESGRILVWKDFWKMENGITAIYLPLADLPEDAKRLIQSKLKTDRW